MSNNPINCMQSQENQVERVVLEVRQLIMAGEFPAGSKIAEIPMAQRLGVSRTPVRLALGTLESEGLLVNLPRRGFVVKQVTVREILQALAVQGMLEAMACVTVAVEGMQPSTRIELELCLEEGDRLVAKHAIEEGDATLWSDMNGRFHAAIVAAAANPPLQEAISHNSRLPFVGARSLAFTSNMLDLSFRRMEKRSGRAQGHFGRIEIPRFDSCGAVDARACS